MKELKRFEQNKRKVSPQQAQMLQDHIYYKKVSGAHSKYTSIQDDFTRKEKRDIHSKVMEILRPDKRQREEKHHEVPNLKDEAF